MNNLSAKKVYALIEERNIDYGRGPNRQTAIVDSIETAVALISKTYWKTLKTTDQEIEKVLRNNEELRIDNFITVWLDEVDYYCKENK